MGVLKLVPTMPLFFNFSWSACFATQDSTPTFLLNFTRILAQTGMTVARKPNGERPQAEVIPPQRAERPSVQGRGRAGRQPSLGAWAGDGRAGGVRN